MKSSPRRRARDSGGVVEGVPRYRVKAKGMHQDGRSFEPGRGYVSQQRCRTLTFTSLIIVFVNFSISTV